MTTEITRITLENEMDIVAAHKRMIGVAQFFSLPLSIQATIATAVAEVTQVVIDRTDNGWLSIGMDAGNGLCTLVARVGFPSETEVRLSDEGLKYAQLLVPAFNFDRDEESDSIRMSIVLPRAQKITATWIGEAVEFFHAAQPTPYEKERFSRLLDEKRDKFISVASHELKTPLTSIMAFTQLALEAGEAETLDTVRHYLEKIDHQVHKLNGLVQQLLDISGIEAGRLDYNIQELEWNGYMSRVIPILEHLVPFHRLSWLPCPLKVMVRMDMLRIEQVLTNLVNNAAKYSLPDTDIDITCKVDDDCLTVCVRDQGIGVSKHNIHRLFDKYFREEAVTDKYSGFGMGLYITSGIVRQHNGTIWAEKNKGAGSSFYFTLPLTPPTLISPPPSPQSRSPLPLP